jgi:hypothetical protein
MHISTGCHAYMPRKLRKPRKLLKARRLACTARRLCPWAPPDPPIHHLSPDAPLSITQANENESTILDKLRGDPRVHCGMVS